MLSVCWPSDPYSSPVSKVLWLSILPRETPIVAFPDGAYSHIKSIWLASVGWLVTFPIWNCFDSLKLQLHIVQPNLKKQTVHVYIKIHNLPVHITCESWLGRRWMKYVHLVEAFQRGRLLGKIFNSSSYSLTHSHFGSITEPWILPSMLINVILNKFFKNFFLLCEKFSSCSFLISSALTPPATTHLSYAGHFWASPTSHAMYGF